VVLTLLCCVYSCLGCYTGDIGEIRPFLQSFSNSKFNYICNVKSNLLLLYNYIKQIVLSDSNYMFLLVFVDIIPAVSQ